MKNKLKNSNLLSCLGFSVIFAVFKIALVRDVPFGGFADRFVNTTYSPADLEGTILSFGIVLALPILLQFLTATYVYEDLSGAIVFILPRAGTLRRWFFGRVRLLLRDCAASVCTVTLLLGGYSAYKCGMPQKNDWLILLTVLLTQILFCFSAVLFVNILSIVISEKWACFAGVAGMLSAAACLYPSRKHLFLLFINPVYNYFILWRENTLLYKPAFEAEFTAGDRVPAETAVLFFGLCAALEVAVGLLLLRKKDFLSLGR